MRVVGSDVDVKGGERELEGRIAMYWGLESAVKVESIVDCAFQK